MFKLEDSDDDSGCFLRSAVTGAVIFGIVTFFLPWTVPFRFLEFWTIKEGDIRLWVYSVGFIFIWAAGVNIIYHLIYFRTPQYNDDIGSKFIAGSITSILAGVLEEISFRWLIFLGSIITIKFTNFLFFGFLGFGVLQWVHINILGPIANLTTLGYLQEQLMNPEGWAVGAALLASNALFRDGHKYQGLFGVVNSWFIGMVMFWVLFRYGLVACIFLHFLYDFVIDIVVLIMRMIHKQVYG